MSNISELDFLRAKSSFIKPESIPQELQQRLSLYQVFVKLYENHGSLLEQILRSENLPKSSLDAAQSYYMQAVVDGEAVYITTNLRDGKSQSFRQFQNTWTIGRDRNSGIHIANKYISRHHAAIRYIEQSFYLIDLGSTNGTYINGEQVYHPTKLKEGDVIQVGNITFPFFVNSTCCDLPTVAVELLMQLVSKANGNKKSQGKTETSTSHKSKTKTRKLNYSENTQAQAFADEIAKRKTFEEQLNQKWKSDILERFYHKQTRTDYF
ncbi:FHA domain-containing protein [Rivularia sp. PCC 7116]|uniref:FHA domain-containing protein n=1 Tax=Rivularia sp. PCC 7116 TaxID=373994 RepID=UPI00029EFE98|nr:FHA domain-containing protein [Rivularia sp. PCC 7116]AFY57692.1 FHA domain-containing protein [Rivularia sp. PCC 7116]